MAGTFSQLDVGIWAIENLSNNTIIGAVFVEKLSASNQTIAHIEHWAYASVLKLNNTYKLRQPVPNGQNNLEDRLSQLTTVAGLLTEGATQTWLYIPAFCPLAKQL